MKLSNLFPPIKTDTQARTPAKKAEDQPAPKTEATQAPETDRVELSNGSLDVQKMTGILRETPEVRIEKVQALREQIDNGAYQIAPHRVADKMLMDLLAENLSID